MQLKPGLVRQVWVFQPFVEGDGVFHAVKIGRAIRTPRKMFLDLATPAGIQSHIKIVANVLDDILAMYSSLLHAFMYPCNCSRRNIRARRSLDFTAGMESLRIVAVSAADFPSISRKAKTTL